jgi:hypothetical protein
MELLQLVLVVAEEEHILHMVHLGVLVLVLVLMVVVGTVVMKLVLVVLLELAVRAVWLLLHTQSLLMLLW